MLMEVIMTIKEFIEKAGIKGAILGVDYGARRIGLSLSDPRREFTFPAGQIDNQDITSSALKIKELIEEKKVSGVVIGYPIQLDGTESEQCKVIKNFAEVLLNQFSGPIFFQDERLSSKGAQTMLRELKLTRKRRDAIDDEVAACNILKTALDLLKTL